MGGLAGAWSAAEAVHCTRARRTQAPLAKQRQHNRQQGDAGGRETAAQALLGQAPSTRFPHTARALAHLGGRQDLAAHGEFVALVQHARLVRPPRLQHACGRGRGRHGGGGLGQVGRRPWHACRCRSCAAPRHTTSLLALPCARTDSRAAPGMESTGSGPPPSAQWLSPGCTTWPVVHRLTSPSSAARCLPSMSARRTRWGVGHSE